MAHDFERIGREQVLKDLTKKIKGKAEYLQTQNLKKMDKLQTLEDLEQLSSEARTILTELL